MASPFDIIECIGNCAKAIAALVAIYPMYRIFWGRYLPKVITDGHGKKYRLINPGEYSRGDGLIPDLLKEKFPELSPWVGDCPNVPVKIKRPFFMAETPVTVAEYRKFVEAQKHTTHTNRYLCIDPSEQWITNNLLSWENPGFPQTDEHPVVCVSWLDAMAYVDWLNSRPDTLKKLRKKYQYFLPTEAQWEYACRSGTTTEFFWGDDVQGGYGSINAADQTLNPYGNKWTYMFPFPDNIVFTAKADMFKANPWGLYNMLGNVWEWCCDHYSADYYTADKTPLEEPLGPAEGKLGKYPSRVVRGGSWTSPPGKCRCAFRGNEDKDVARTDIGFRVAIVERDFVKQIQSR